MIAEGAGHFRQPRLVERIARRLSGVPMSAALRSRLKRWYVAVLSAQTGGRGLQASLPGGEVVRVLPEFGHIGWNPDEYRAFREAVRPGMTALDVGANVGGYALLLGQWVGAAGAVHAFEPAPTAYDGLARHVTLNELEGVVHPVRLAAGARSSMTPMFVAESHGESRLAPQSGSGQSSAGSRGPATIDVVVTTIDEYCRQFALEPGFIKIDVEGAELDVLRGARETIRRCRSRLALFVEMHPTVWPQIGVSTQDIESELRAQSLDISPLVPASDIWALEGLCVRLVPR
jgi:FkbM family methyltransferase